MIFSEEKKYNLYGPDDFKYYWHNLRFDRKIMSRRVQGGGSVMVWAGITQLLRTELAFVNSRMNATAYQELLHDYLLPFITVTKDESITFSAGQCTSACSRHYKTVASRVRNPNIEVASIESAPESYREWFGILARKV